MRAFVVAGVALSIPGRSVAQPPPPPPSFMHDLAMRLVPTQTAASFGHYADCLADDLTVSIDVKQVAANKAAWIAAERHRLGKVDRRVEGYVEGYDTILVIDRYDDRSDLPTTPTTLFDPRYQTPASQFVVGADQKVHAIRILEADGSIRSAR